MRKRVAIALTLAVAAIPVAGATASAPSGASVPPPVIAVIESGGLNVLHTDFKLSPGESLAFPKGMPKPRWITLPSSGTFEERVAALQRGELGDMKQDTLYWIKGTRLGVYNPPGSHTSNLLEARIHPTGTVSAAIGLEHGTNPDALAVYVADTGPGAWDWLTDQHWIDTVSASYFSLIASGEGVAATCPAYREMEAFADTGRILFSAAGNADQAGRAFVPAGSPVSYQVGGVDENGRSYVPGPDHQEISVTPTRPYETGDRFDFPAADADSLEGSMDFGGTSGATPSTAGRAAELITWARGVLRSHHNGVRNGALAIASSDAGIPDRGPLADGRLEHDELIDLLHHVAIPAEEPTPVRYLVEGYGALNDKAVALAKKVLTGQAPEPQRPEEDAMHEQVESLRPLFFPEGRC